MDNHQCKILVVDDSESDRFLLTCTLESLDNIEIIQASSGHEAIEKLSDNDFTVVLLDINMPGMNGYEVAKYISSVEDHKHTPIMMVTAQHASSQDVLLAYEAGAVDYITKPVVPLIVRNKVKQFVVIKQLQVKTDYLKSEHELILESAGQGVIKVNSDSTIQFINSKGSQLINAIPDKVVGTLFSQWFQRYHNDTIVEEDFFPTLYKQVRLRGSHQQREIRLNPQDRNNFPVEITCTVTQDYEESPMIILFQDVTERVILERRLLHLANYDPLTQLANRAYFHDTLMRAIARTKRLNCTMVFLMLDLDRFKLINDTLGHDIGDELLQSIALRLKSILRDNDMAARLGGDEFAVLIEDCTSVQEAEDVATRILVNIAKPLLVQGKEITIETSIGIACCENGEPNESILTKWADIALYAAKSAGRNTFQRFIPAMSEQAEQQAFIQNQLRLILESRAFNIYYQPQVSLIENRVVGFEALIRWQESGYGETPISPDQFIPIAEQSRLIQEIGEFVLIQACELLEHWQTMPDKKDLTLSINLSAKQLTTPNFLVQLDNVLHNYTFTPNQLIFEITETAVLDHSEDVINTLHTLKSLGFDLALDDFGTGYSSLNYLQNLPFDIIKIDQCFIQRLGNCKKTWALVEAIMTIANAFEMDVVAEGVEDLLQLNSVMTLGCDKVQGFYFSKPVPVNKIDESLSMDSLLSFTSRSSTVA